MSKEKRCWICRRNAKEVMKDAPMLTCDIPEKEIIFRGVNLKGIDIFYICHGCNELLWNLIHHKLDGELDESDLVEFQDLDKIIKKVKDALEG